MLVGQRSEVRANGHGDLRASDGRATGRRSARRGPCPELINLVAAQPRRHSQRVLAPSILSRLSRRGSDDLGGDDFFEEVAFGALILLAVRDDEVAVERSHQPHRMYAPALTWARPRPVGHRYDFLFAHGPNQRTG